MRVVKNEIRATLVYPPQQASRDDAKINKMVAAESSLLLCSANNVDCCDTIEQLLTFTYFLNTMNELQLLANCMQHCTVAEC